jgi:hypothetical protein
MVHVSNGRLTATFDYYGEYGYDELFTVYADQLVNGQWIPTEQTFSYRAAYHPQTAAPAWLGLPTNYYRLFFKKSGVDTVRVHGTYEGS